MSGRTGSGVRRAVPAPFWLASKLPSDTAILHVRIREGIQLLAERRGHASLAIGMRLLADLQGFLVYATGRPGHVSAHAAALWNMWQPADPDPVLNDFLDTCARMIEPNKAADFWPDFLATVRGALVS